MFIGAPYLELKELLLINTIIFQIMIKHVALKKFIKLFIILYVMNDICSSEAEYERSIKIFFPLSLIN